MEGDESSRGGDTAMDADCKDDGGWVCCWNAHILETVSPNPCVYNHMTPAPNEYDHHSLTAAPQELAAFGYT